MADLNFPNRTLGIMDNLTFLRAINSESIDLIAIDPPFAANETFEGRPKPPITDAERAEERALAARHGDDALARYQLEHKSLTSVKDDWFFRNVDPSWMAELREVSAAVKHYDRRIEEGERPADIGYPPTERERTLAAIMEVIEAVQAVATENEAAYIALMSVRLYECRRVLKDTGSIYVHCDPHANSYLRILMDAIFGHKNFRREVIWQMPPASGFKTRTNNWIRGHDTILYYTKSEKGTTFNKQFTPYSEEYIAKMFKGRDADGRRYRDRGYKRFYEDEDGIPMPDVWTDITSFQTATASSEYVGYSTQKPLALYQRIIRASSNPGDTVLDLFAGCATTAVAAEMEGRNWIACDMAYRASTMMMRRFYQNDIILSNMNADVVHEAMGPHTGTFPSQHKRGLTIGPPDLARFPRTTPDIEGVPDPKTAKRQRAPIRSNWNGGISKTECKEILIAEYGPRCWGCHFDARRPNGSINRSQIEVDHIQAKRAEDGVYGDDQLDNLALLCAYCNRTKANRLTLAQLREKNERDGVLYNIDRADDLLPHEFTARRFAHRIMMERGLLQAELRELIEEGKLSYSR